MEHLSPLIYILLFLDFYVWRASLKKFARKFYSSLQHGVFSLIPNDIFIRLRNFLNIVGKLQTNVIRTKSNKKLIHSMKSAVTQLKIVSKHTSKKLDFKILKSADIILLYFDFVRDRHRHCDVMVRRRCTYFKFWVNEF